MGVGGEGIGALVQSDVSLADLTENLDGSAVGATPPRFSNDFVPQGTKFVLQFRKSVVHVKLGKRGQNERRPGTGAKGLASHVDQEGKQRAVTMPDVVPKHRIWYTKFSLC